MMKIISIILIIITLTIVCSGSQDVTLNTSTDTGQSIMRAARRLEDGDERDFSWTANYSIKYLGCHTVKQWNLYADDNEDVKIAEKRLVRFRLCPSNSCGGGKGCSQNFGDYVVDMDTYVKAYAEAARRSMEYECQMYLYQKCNCQDGDDQGDDFNKEYCEYDCFSRSKKMSQNCIDKNPYEDDDNEMDRNRNMDMNRILEGGCNEFEAPDNANRRLDGQQQADDDDEVNYYVGSYCADQGGRIYVGLFTDDTCSVFADKNAGRTTYKALTGGLDMPYSTSSVVGNECLSCLKRKDPNHDENNDNGDIEITEACEKSIMYAGKCETKLKSGPTTLNQAACEYIEGIKLTLKSGIIDTSATRPNKVVSFFIFLFAVSFVLFGSYVYYLRIKLRMSIIDL